MFRFHFTKTWSVGTQQTLVPQKYNEVKCDMYGLIFAANKVSKVQTVSQTSPYKDLLNWLIFLTMADVSWEHC